MRLMMICRVSLMAFGLAILLTSCGGSTDSANSDQRKGVTAPLPQEGQRNQPGAAD
jgi:hypothetical protein